MDRTGPIRALAYWLALSACLHAQQYVFRAYRQAEGLKNLAVNALATDRKGFLWLATENGVYRFLGSEFVRFGPEQGIAEVDIQAILVDQSGAVWAGTGGNLYRWDGRRFVPAQSAPIHIAAWNDMAVEDAHHLLIVEDKRLNRIEFDDRGQVVSYLPVFPAGLVQSNPGLAHVFSVSVVSDPLAGVQIWFGGGKKLYRYTDRDAGNGVQPGNGRLEEWGKAQGIEEDIWAGVLLDRAGTLWAGGRYRVAALPRGAARFIDRSIPGSNPGNVYPHAPLVEDREGRILAPSEVGVARWDGGGWRDIGPANGLQLTGHVVGIAFDRAGDPWLAIRGDGVYNWAGYEDWEGWNDSKSLPSSVIWAAVPTQDGRIVIGTDRGPAWIDPRSGGSGPVFTSARWTFGQVDTMGANRDGTLWGGTFSGAVLRIDPKTGKAEQTAKLPSFITRSVADAAGRVFYTTDDGIYLRPSEDSKAAPQRVREVDRFLTGSTQVDAGCRAADGTLWFLTNNRLLRFRDGVWTKPPMDGMPRIRGSMLDISCGPDGAIWVTGQQTGTWRLTPGGERVDAWQLVLPHELQTQTPVALVADRHGWVWLGTDAGLLVWNGLAWRHLTQESGLTWNDVNQGVMLSASDGSMWIGTSGGMAHLLHPERVFDAVPISTLITGIRRGEDSYPPDQPIRLPWSALPLNFQISSPATRNRAELTFKYRMDGLQPEWIESHDGVAIFSALPPGDYTFMAMAYDPCLSAYSSLVKVKVSILPPWWRSSWFYTFCALAFLLLVAGADWLRARHLLRTRRRLEKLVRERTLELEASRELLRIQATHDDLTGMLNRVGILRVLSAEMDRARRERTYLVIALADLDHFKRVNDEHGHLAGDEALRWFAAAVSAATRSYDHAGRYGGEEFLLVLPDIPPGCVEQRLASLHGAISNLQVETTDGGFALNCSIGATVLDPRAKPASPGALLAIADKALYAAKAGGRNRFVFRAQNDSTTDSSAGSDEDSLVHHGTSRSTLR